MYFYRQKDKDGNLLAYLACETEQTEENHEEISEEEYEAAIEELQRRVESEETEAEQTKDERIAELEAENAAFLYQVLTGEELTDV